MKPPGQVPPRMPVAVTCTCGQQIVIEGKSVGKATSCPSCHRQFTVRLLMDAKTRRWSPHVTFLPVAQAAEPPKQTGPKAWFTVACRCGHKIGLDSSFLGRDMTCKACHRQFTVKVVDGGDGNDTAVIRYARDTVAMPSPETPRIDPRRKQETARGKAVARPSEALEPPPSEMHLLCMCGEELTVEQKFFNDKLCCGGCGTVMKLRLIFVPDRGKYELEARVVDPRAE